MHPGRRSQTFGHRAPDSPRAIVPPLAARLIRSVLITFSIAQWCRAVLADTSVAALLLITFAWATTINLHLMRDDKETTLREKTATPDRIGGFLTGQLLWLVPLLRTFSPNHWFWHPVHIPPALILTGAMAAALLPVATVLGRLRHNSGGESPSAPPEFDVAVLCAAIFLTTGAPLWAAGAVGLAMPIVLHRRLKAGRELSRTAPVNVCAIVP
jgi:hypothetical protein